MAFTPNSNLLSDPFVTLRDQQHAAKLFNTDQFRLAPKFKFLFHVTFNINPAATKNIQLVQRHKNEINMLVKSVDLPSYAIQSEILNQYNRKKAVQYQVKYNEIGIKFHDDNMGLINQLWQNYYSYYYADSTSAKVSGAYERTATKSSDYIVTPYGLDNASSTPFFSSIVIWQAARHEYVAYKLHNPIITTWNHNKLDYSQNQIHDFDMKLNYESVSYYTGIVGESTGDLDMDSGFGVEHYDDVSSPLTGQLNTSGPSFAGNGALEASAESILNTAITQINTAQNTQSLGTTITNKVNAANTALSGLQGFAFPK